MHNIEKSCEEMLLNPLDYRQTKIRNVIMGMSAFYLGSQTSTMYFGMMNADKHPVLAIALPIMHLTSFGLISAFGWFFYLKRGTYMFSGKKLTIDKMDGYFALFSCMVLTMFMAANFFSVYDGYVTAGLLTLATAISLTTVVIGLIYCLSEHRLSLASMRRVHEHNRKIIRQQAFHSGNN